MTLLEKYNLLEWFNTVFSEEEKKIIYEKYPDFNTGIFNGSSSSWLACTSDYFNTKENKNICEKFITKSILENNETDAENIYFNYAFYIKYFYKNREENDNLQTAIYYCLLQKDLYPASIAPADCVGYTQLAIIYKKNKEWENIIKLCDEAIKKNVGGDWLKRKEEAETKLKK